MSKMEETIAVIIYEINLLVSYFLFLGESSICETIAADYLGRGVKDDVFEIYRLLIYMNHELSPK